MKKLILAGMVIIIGCLIFIIIQQNSSQADIDMDIHMRTYPVPFGDWVGVWLSSIYRIESLPSYQVLVGQEGIEGKARFKIAARYNSNTESGRLWYSELYPIMKESIRLQCARWTLQGYPISLNDFEFDIQEF